MMLPVKAARFMIGFTLACAPLVCHAQATDTGANLLGRLSALANSGLTLEALAPSSAAQGSWTTELKRYSERSRELRARCHDDIRSANRDTIAGRSALCLRSDLLLEIAHRRKQREWVESLPGVSPISLINVVGATNTWIDAATSVIDGIDAGVFQTAELSRSAKKNLHENYRMTMLTMLTRARASRALSALTAAALALQGPASADPDPTTLLSSVVPCLETAHALLTAGKVAATNAESAASLRTGSAQLQECLAMID